MSLRLIACSVCSNYVKANESHCIVCGAALHGESSVVARTAGAVLMGLSLTGCPTDDTTGDSMAGTEPSTTQAGTETSSSSSSTTMAETMSSTTNMPTGTETTDPGSDSSTFSGESAYGVPGTGTTIAETDSGSGTDTDTDTDGETETTAADTGSTSVSPDYGVPETGR